MNCEKLLYPADILLPKKGFEKWAVVACDQYTSQPEYWKDVENTVGNAPSTLHMVLPEIYLKPDNSERIDAINAKMYEYLDNDIFEEFKSSMIYVKRTVGSGKIRRGVIGMIDLEKYDYRKGSTSLIRATEGTVIERIPPRVAIRKDAPLELPHIMLLIDDPEKTVIEPLENNSGKKAYDFDLIAGGGHIEGTVIGGEEQNRINAALAALCNGEEKPMLFAVGDGNHSLATAKSCYDIDRLKTTKYALVEVVNIHDEALEFEPIYRVIFNVDTNDILEKMSLAFSKLKGTMPAQKIEYVTKNGNGIIEIPSPESNLTVSTLQTFLDNYLKNNPRAEVDYIHGIDVTRKLGSGDNAIGFLFDGMSKDQLFPAVKNDGALPRKTFSMGEAFEKRFYLECRKIK